MGDRGYTYWVSDEQLRTFASMTPARRLQWLEEMREITFKLAPPRPRVLAETASLKRYSRSMRILAALALLAGCGGLDPEDFDEAYLDARCEYYVRCGLFDDLDACRADAARVAIDDPSIVAAIDAGKMTYDEAAADDCVTALANLSCDYSTYTGHELDACDDVFTGTGAQDAPCAFDKECTSERCVVPDCAQACCTGTCGPPRAIPGIGESCSSVCIEGARCGLDGICHASLPSGSACTDPLLCERGLYCAGWSSTTAGACAPYPQHGEPCDGACASIGDVCNGTCVAAGLTGDPCASDANCSTFYQCDTTQRCAPFPTRGMPCESTCSDDSWCNNGTCDAQKGNGATCTYNDECTSHYCDGTCMDVPLCI